MPSIYLSPSTQEFNNYYDGSGSEEYYMNLIADAMEPYLEASGIYFERNDRDESLGAAIDASNAVLTTTCYGDIDFVRRINFAEQAR